MAPSTALSMALLMAGDAPLAEMATCPGSRLPYREPPPWMPQLPARQGSRDRGIEGGRAHASIKGNGVRTEGIAWKASVGGVPGPATAMADGSREPSRSRGLRAPVAVI